MWHTRFYTVAVVVAAFKGLVPGNVQPTQTIFAPNTSNTQPIPVAVCANSYNLTLNATGTRNLNAAQLDDGSYDPLGNFLFFKIRRVVPGNCGSDSLFRSQLTFCCEDAGDTVEVTLRVYNVAVDTGGIAPQFGAGNYADCTARVIVGESVKPVISAMPNITVNCDDYTNPAFPVEYPVATDNCCMDTILYADQHITYDIACKRGNIRRRFTAYDCAGNTAVTTQMILVEHKQQYFVQFPNDIIITGCADLSQESLGKPVVQGNGCENMNITYLDSVQYNTQAGAGPCIMLKRSWRVFNWCKYSGAQPLIFVPNPTPESNLLSANNLVGPMAGPQGIATVVKINPTDTAQTDYSIFWDENANGYLFQQKIYIYDMVEPQVALNSAPYFCDETTNDPTLWKGSNWYNPVENSDDLFECPVNTGIRLFDNCSYNDLSVQYMLYLDLNSDGVEETVVNSTIPPPAGTIIYNNLLPGQSEQRAFDRRITGIENKYLFAVEKYIANDTLHARIRWNTMSGPNQYIVPHLPYGYHRVVWTVLDRCGNSKTFEHLFSVSDDCEPPVVTCIPGIEVNIPELGNPETAVSVNSLLLTVGDNETPAPLIQLAVERPPFGTKFPVNTMGSPIQTVNYGCSDRGYREARLWARDEFGNAAFCTTTVIVSDPYEACQDYLPSVSGTAENMHGDPMVLDFELYKMPDTTLIGTSSNLEQGYYYFNDLEPFGNYFVKPSLDSSNILNGVNAFDLILISRHILNLEPLSSPYKLIAADVNRSGTITTFDIVTARKALLGTISEFPNNKSWRFVPVGFNFPIPENPFAAPFPEQYNLSSVYNMQENANFYCIKVGDVDLNAEAHFFTESSDRHIPEGLHMILGTEVNGRTPVYLQALEPLDAFQLALHIPTATDYTSEWLSDEYISRSGNIVRMVGDQPLSPDKERILLGWIKGDAQQVQLVNNGSLTPKAFTPSGAPRTIGLYHTANNPESMVHIQPNPASGIVQLWAPVTQPGKISLKITDIQGKTLLDNTTTCQEGIFRHPLDIRLWPDGLYQIQLVSPNGIQHGKLIKVTAEK